MDTIENNRKQVEYLATLLSGLRGREQKDSNPSPTLNFDTLLEMVTCSESSQRDTQESISTTLETQYDVENMMNEIYDEILEQGSNNFPALARKKHLGFAQYFFSNPLPQPFTVLDASHPWISYWLLNSAVLLKGNNVEAKVELDTELKQQVGQAILSFVDEETGGIAGGEGQIAHAAASYAGILSLCITNDEQIMGRLNTEKIYHWLMELKQEDGSFVMHIGGEKDTRAVYCVLCVASLLNIVTDELVRGTVEWLTQCQTYEGGFGGVPHDEAHGGYTFCGLASLCILLSPTEIKQLSDSPTNDFDLDKLIEWSVKRQYQLEGGLSGRTNKLVDGCYSHWVGGLSPLLETITENKLILNRMALQNYILGCCQDENAGLRDKPGKRSDFYHTNYVLCGLSMCQSKVEYAENSKLPYAFNYTATKRNDAVVDQLPENQIGLLDPVFGVPAGFSKRMYQFYSSK